MAKASAPSWTALAAVAALLLAGCLDGGGGAGAPIAQPPASPALDVQEFPAALQHDHADRGLHLAAAGLERVAHLRAAAGDAPAQGAYNLAIGTDLLVASLSSVAGAGALAPGLTLLVVDLADPEAPRALSTLALPGGGVEAIAISPDDRYAFLGTEFTGFVGIWVVDLADPAAPRIAGYTPLPAEGPHNLRYAEAGGRRLLLASISHVATPPTLLGLPQDTSPVQDLRVDVYEFIDPAVPMRLLSSYAAPGTGGLPQGTPIVHDAVVQAHPVTGQDILYVAHWDEGVRLVDLSDPEHPAEVGSYADPAPTTFLAVHTVKPHPTLLGGRHVTVATSQCAYTPEAACHVRILDTTDPARPVQVGTWALPESVRGGQYTTEIFDLAGGRLLVPWGHAGAWLLDLACAGCLESPQVLGYHFLGDAEPGLPGPMFANAAILRGGLAYVADVPGGIHVLRLPAGSSHGSA